MASSNLVNDGSVNGLMADGLKLVPNVCLLIFNEIF